MVGVGVRTVILFRDNVLEVDKLQLENQDK